MQEQPRSSLSAKRVFNQIGGRYALSNQTVILFALPAFSSAMVLDQRRLGGPLEPRLWMAIAGYLAPVAVLLVFRIFLPDRPRETKLLTVLSAFVLAGIARGLVIYNVGLNLGVFTERELLYRVLGGPVFTFVMLSVSTILVSNFRRYRDTLEALGEERFQLEIKAANIKGQIELQREELLSNVKGLLTPAIARVQANLSKMSDKKSVEKAVVSLKSTVDDVIRPLSQQVSETITPDAVPGLSNPYRKREKAPFPKRVFVADFLFPLWGTILISLSSAPAAFVVEEWPQATLMMVLIFFTILLSLRALSYFGRMATVPTPIAGIAVVASYALSVLPLILYRDFFSWTIQNEVINAFTLFAAFLGVTFFFGELVQTSRRETSERLAQVNTQLEFLNGSLRQEVWLNRRRTAAVLHGPVQAALYASAMRLAQAQNPTPELLESVQRDISEAIERLNEPSDLNQEGLVEVLDQIIDLWSDTSKISLKLDKKLARQIDGQPLAKESVIEVSREFVNNAIKHGKAQNVDLRIDLLDAFRLQITTVNDGLTLDSSKQPGFGSKLLSELTLDWSVKTVDDTTVSRAEIVMARDSL